MEHVGVMGMYLYQRKIRFMQLIQFVSLPIIKFFFHLILVGFSHSGVPENCMGKVVIFSG